MDLPAIQVIERLPYAVIHFENRGFRQPDVWGLILWFNESLARLSLPLLLC
jgi:hypothetical protein